MGNHQIDVHPETLKIHIRPEPAIIGRIHNSALRDLFRISERPVPALTHIGGNQKPLKKVTLSAEQ